MRLSFVIPCYNSAATVRRCLDSVYVLPIPESEYEVIVVNDGSTDDTGTVVGEYGEGHGNLNLIRHLVNRNLGAARNTALAVAKGDCVAFLDSDDEAEPGLVHALKMMEERGLDMVAMRLHRVDGAGMVVGGMTLPYSSEEVFSGIRLQVEHAGWNYGQCINYLYSKALLDKVGYPFVEGVTYEDADFVGHHLFYAKRLSYCDEYCYHYNVTPFSITHTNSPRNVFGYTFMGARLLALYEKVKDMEVPFAQSVLEEGSDIVRRSFLRMSRLGSASEVRQFYNLVDARVDRKALLKYRQPSYCWTAWTRFGLKHRALATAWVGVMTSARNLKSRIAVNG